MKKDGMSRQGWITLLLFGMVGQIAWTVENMYFNLFVFDSISPNLFYITLMVQLSGITATAVTLFAGTLSDKVGNRRAFISLGYLIWGITVALFGFISPELCEKIFSVDTETAIRTALVLAVVGDCIMTVFGSAANDAGFNAWVTDNTEPSYRGKVEGVISILPLIAMLIVAGAFGMIVEAIGYTNMFLVLGIVISLSGLFGIFFIKDREGLRSAGKMKDIFYGFRPSVILSNKPFYLSLFVILIYGIACQIFMPYLIIYMNKYLGFSVIEYSAVFAVAILLGAGVNLYLTALSDRKEKPLLLYVAAGVFAIGLFGMYIAGGMGKTADIIVFGIFGFVMITGYIFISALAGSMIRDFTPEGEVGKLQGVRMAFSVLIPMIIGPMIGNSINKLKNIPLPDSSSADSMTTAYIPAPEIFLVGGAVSLLLFLIVPFLRKAIASRRKAD